MSPRFDREAFEASRAVDHEFGEGFRLDPFTVGADRTAPDAPDPTRLPVCVQAIFSTREDKPAEPKSYDARQDRRPGVASATPWIEISTSAQADATASGLPFAIRAGDHAMRMADKAVYRVVSVFVSASGTISAKLNRIS